MVTGAHAQTNTHEYSSVKAAVGSFDFPNNDSFAYQVDVTAPPFFENYPLRFNLGALGTHKKAIYLYGGFSYDLYLDTAHDVRLSPAISIGYYDDKDDKKLHCDMQFRSGGELNYRVANNWWIGVSFWHISHARKVFKCGASNPGAEFLLFTLSHDYEGWLLPRY